MNLNGRMKSIQKNYSQLTPLERFKLVAAAAARGDETEARALVDTCPRFSYRMSDYSYRQHFYAAGHLGGLVIFEIQAALSAFLLLDPRETSEALLELAAAKWAALNRFCDDLGIETAVFLSYTSYGLVRDGGILARGEPAWSAALFERVVSLADLVEPDPADIDREYEQIKDFWQWATGPNSPL